MSRPTASLTPQSSFAHSRTTWLWALNLPDAASIPVLVQNGEISLMHIKSKWTRSFLFAASGLMLSIGIFKIEDKTTGLTVITGGLISLLSLLSQDPNQESK